MSISEEAIQFAKAHKIEISRRLTDPRLFLPSEAPISFFMAGSPGAGKTEYSKNMLVALAMNPKHHPVRIDGDELRNEIPGYIGSNSSEVQGAVSILLRETYQRTLINRQTVIVDGTFSNYDKARENVGRSLRRGREVAIMYMYQRPEAAWQFTVAREKIEGRNIPKEVFIDQFLRAKDTVSRIHTEFQSQVTIYLIKKNYQNNQVEFLDFLRPGGPGLDAFISETYTREQLIDLL